MGHEFGYLRKIFSFGLNSRSSDSDKHLAIRELETFIEVIDSSVESKMHVSMLEMFGFCEMV